jgi:hypothetical protein
VQDEPLAWGAAADAEVEDTTAFKKAGHTKHSGPTSAETARRDAVSPEADAASPETTGPGEAQGRDAATDAGARIVCGKLVPAGEA